MFSYEFCEISKNTFLKEQLRTTFSQLHSIRGNVEVNLLEDPIQNIESDYWRIFQPYFYNNLLVPREESKIIAHKI